MTNEERCKCTYNETGCSDCEWTRLIQENTKLKAEIEQLKSELEQSVKLPCKVGDILFGYCSAFGQILEYELDSVITDEIETIYCISAWSRPIGEYPTECLDELEIQYSDFGKTIFLTREEAEQALKGASNDE